jgi:hypothetical protein
MIWSPVIRPGVRESIGLARLLACCLLEPLPWLGPPEYGIDWFSLSVANNPENNLKGGRLILVQSFKVFSPCLASSCCFGPKVRVKSTAGSMGISEVEQLLLPPRRQEVDREHAAPVTSSPFAPSRPQS